MYRPPNRGLDIPNCITQLTGHILLLLEAGYNAVGFRNCQEGNLVYLLRGARTPMIRRPHSNFYHIICGAYVDVVTKGKAWPDNEEDL